MPVCSSPLTGDRGGRLGPPAPLPPFLTMAAHMVVAVACVDTGFFWTHRYGIRIGLRWWPHAMHRPWQDGRLLHHPRLYARVHKLHHEYTGPIGFAAERAHPLETILSNHVSSVAVVVARARLTGMLLGGRAQLPVVLGPILVGMHPTLWACMLAWRLWRTYEVHRSGCSCGQCWATALPALT